MPGYDLIISPNAEKDLTRAFCWYEAESKGLAVGFMAAYRRQCDRLASAPFMYAKYRKEIRRCSLTKFPYHLYYLIDEDRARIDIIAVLHQSRDPLLMDQRLGGRE